MANETTPVVNNTVAEATAVTPTETETTSSEGVDRPVRRPREKVRSIDILLDAPVKSMSDREKALLIEHYRMMDNKQKQQIEAYRHNAEEAFKKAQLFERNGANIAEQSAAKFNDIIQAVSVLYKTVYLIAKDGMNND